MSGMLIGIDLGTAFIKAYVAGKGIVLCEANAICYDAKTLDVVAVGNDAMAMADRTPDTLLLKRPMHAGVISEFSVMRDILSFMLQKVCKNAVFRPNLIISAPSCLTAPEKRAILDIATSCGAAKVSLLQEPVASAIGAGLSVEHPHGVMVVDCGAGTTDIAVITMGTVAYATALPLGGDDFDEAICRYVRRTKDILIGKPTAQRLKHQIGCAFAREEEFEAAANGKDFMRSMPQRFTITSTELCQALQEPVQTIAEAMQDVLEQLPPELYADVCSEGITLTGGSGALYGLDRALQEKLKIKVHTAADGANSAAKGAGLLLRELKDRADDGYLFRLREREV